MFYIQRCKNKSSTKVVYIELNKTRIKNLLSVIDNGDKLKQSQDAFEDNRLGFTAVFLINNSHSKEHNSMHSNLNSTP